MKSRIGDSAWLRAIAAPLPWGNPEIGAQSYRGDDACAAKAAADRLHCARIDTEAFRNDAHT
jgi:hypothetical protein